MEPIKEATKKDYTERMLKVFTYIQHHLDEDVSLETLAQEACFSPYHFHRIFRGIVGESVKEHTRRIKLERAAARLKQTDRRIIRIALEAGYEAHEAFSRAFKRMFGLSPTQYRAANQSFEGSKAGVHYRPDGCIREFDPWKQETQPMKAEIKDIQPMKVAFVRHTGPYDQCGRAWEKICTWAGPNGYLQPGAKFIGLCYDDPDVTPPDKIRYDACITVDENCKPDGEIGIQTIEGGLYAMATHEGSYKKLGETYAALCGRWIPQNGYEIRSLPGFEVYLNDPNSTPEAELLTDVHIPVERK